MAFGLLLLQPPVLATCRQGAIQNVSKCFFTSFTWLLPLVFMSSYTNGLHILNRPCFGSVSAKPWIYAMFLSLTRLFLNFLKSSFFTQFPSCFVSYSHHTTYCSSRMIPAKLKGKDGMSEILAVSHLDLYQLYT